MDENLAVSLVESREPVHQHVAPLVRESGRLGGRSRVPRDTFARSAEGERRATPGGASTITRFVGDDPQQPGPKRRAAADAPDRAPRLDESVLDGFVSVWPRDHVRDSEGDVVVHAHELREGVFVPPLGAAYKLALLQWTALHCSYYTGR